MSPSLSPRTKKIVLAVFKTKHEEASQWLETECGNNLPFCENYDEHAMERIRFAALKISNGNVSNLLRAIDLARTDWRDLLMEAGFGTSLQAHETWAEGFFNNA